MKTSMHGEKKEYREQVEHRVVGQLFFQEVTSVDRHKTRFNEVGYLCLLPDACVAHL